MAKYDFSEVTGESLPQEWIEHPTEGYISFDPRTMYINKSPTEGGVKHAKPIKLFGKFVGTKQPYVNTCSEPTEGNAGCPSWAGCPFKKWPYVGPGLVRMKKRGTVSMSSCVDYFESTRGGRPTTQLHHGMDGWELDFSDTTFPQLGRDWAIKAGIIDESSPREKVIATKPKVSWHEIGDLLPPWWPLLKKKGLPLPESAKMYPELAEGDEETPKPKKRGRPKKQAE